MCHFWPSLLVWKDTGKFQNIAVKRNSHHDVSSHNSLPNGRVHKFTSEKSSFRTTHRQSSRSSNLALTSFDLCIAHLPNYLVTTPAPISRVVIISGNTPLGLPGEIYTTCVTSGGRHAKTDRWDHNLDTHCKSERKVDGAPPSYSATSIHGPVKPAIVADAHPFNFTVRNQLTNQASRKTLLQSTKAELFQKGDFPRCWGEERVGVVRGLSVLSKGERAYRSRAWADGPICTQWSLPSPPLMTDRGLVLASRAYYLFSFFSYLGGRVGVGDVPSTPSWSPSCDLQVLISFFFFSETRAVLRKVISSSLEGLKRFPRQSVKSLLTIVTENWNESGLPGFKVFMVKDLDFLL